MVDLQRSVLHELESFIASSNSNSSVYTLLVDAKTLTTISLACPQSKLMRKAVYLYEKLEACVNNGSNNQGLNYVTCLVICAGSERNFQFLSTELRWPRFGCYKVLLTDHSGPKDRMTAVKRLADIDLHARVSEVKLASIDFVPVERFVFTAKERPVYKIASENEECLMKSAHTLASLLIRLGVSHLGLCHSRDSRICEFFLEHLEKRLAETDKSRFESKRKMNVLVVDRLCDALTPLMNQWTYQAMVHEIFGIENNFVNIELTDDNGEPLVDPKTGSVERHSVSLSSSDVFFSSNRYDNFGVIGERIKKLVEKYQQKKQESQNQSMETIADITRFVANYPEFQKLSGAVTRHVTIVSELSKQVTMHHLLKVSEFEQNLSSAFAKSVNNSGDRSIGSRLLSELNDILQLQLRSCDLKRILALLSIVADQIPGLGFTEVRKIVHKKPESERAELNSLIEAFRRLAPLASSSLSRREFSSSSSRTPMNMLRGLQGVENVFTQHQPLLKHLLGSVLLHKVIDGLEYSPDFRFGRDTIVYVVGGLTYEEVRLIRDMNVEHDANVLVGGCNILRSHSFIEDIIKAHT